MTRDELASRLARMSADERIAVLSRFAFELTIAARETYVPGTEEIAEPARLRAFNEVQHRVTGMLLQLADPHGAPYPDATVADMLLGSAQSLRVQSALETALERGVAA